MKEALTKGGHGRSLMNKMPRSEKRRLDRQVDKRRRQEGKKEIEREVVVCDQGHYGFVIENGKISK